MVNGLQTSRRRGPAPAAGRRCPGCRRTSAATARRVQQSGRPAAPGGRGPGPGVGPAICHANRNPDTRKCMCTKRCVARPGFHYRTSRPPRDPRPAQIWKRLSAGDGAKGPRLCLGRSYRPNHRGHTPDGWARRLLGLPPDHPCALREKRCLLAHLTHAVPDWCRTKAWSHWQRRHQCRARISHYQRRQRQHHNCGWSTSRSDVVPAATAETAGSCVELVRGIEGRTHAPRTARPVTSCDETIRTADPRSTLRSSSFMLRPLVNTQVYRRR